MVQRFKLLSSWPTSVNSGVNNFSTALTPGRGSAFAGYSIGTGPPGAFVGLSVSGTAYNAVGGHMANTNNNAQYTGASHFGCK